MEMIKAFLEQQPLFSPLRYIAWHRLRPLTLIPFTIAICPMVCYALLRVRSRASLRFTPSPEQVDDCQWNAEADRGEI